MPLDLAATSVKGLDIKGLEKLFRDDKFRKWWKELSEMEKKDIQITTNVSGTDDIEKLVKSLDSLSKSSDKYFGEIKKYKSAAREMASAYKSGYKNMSLYLKEAKASGGQIAVWGAALSYLTKELKQNINAVEGYVGSVKRYGVEQEKFSRISFQTKDSLKDLRASLSLTKDEMADMFAELKKGEALGLTGESIKGVFENLRQVYGNDAMNILRDYQEILSKMPDVTGQIKGGGFKGFGEEGMYNLMQSGNFSKMLQLRGAGLFGGEQEKSDAAKFENIQKDIRAFTERGKDWASQFFLPSLSYFSAIAEGTTQTVEVLGQIYGILGAMRAMQSVLNLRNAAAGAGGYAGLAGKAGMAGVSGIKLAMAGAAGIGGGQLLGGGIAKLTGGLGYSPKELLSAISKENRTNFKDILFSSQSLKSILNAATLRGGSVQTVSEEKMTEEERDAAKNKASIYAYGKVGDKTVKRNIKQQKDLYDFDKTMGNVFEAVRLFEERWKMFYEDTKTMNDTMADLASLSGDSSKFQSIMLERSLKVKEFHEKELAFYDERIQTIQAQLQKMYEKDPSFRGSDSERGALATIRSLQKGRVQSEKTLFDNFLFELDRRITQGLQFGGTGSRETTLGLAQAQAKAQSRAALATYEGGEFQAFGELRLRNIEKSRDDLIAMDKQVASLNKQMSQTSDKKEILALQERLIDLEGQRASKIEALNSALRDVSDIEILVRSLEAYNKVLSAQTDYVQNVNNSFVSLKPFWEEEIRVKRQDVEMAKQMMERAGQGTARKEAEAEYAVKILDLKKAEFELAKRTRDKRKEEVEFAADWMQEQANYMEEMGGHFSDVIAMRSSAIAKERESIAFLAEMLEDPQLTGQERFRAEVELEKQKMKITKDTIGIQKSAYEKFVGMAFGALGDIGFKKGTMDDAILMGTQNTRIKNRSGLYISGAPNMTRDELSAMMATGSVDGISRQGDLKNVDYFTGMRAAKVEAKPEMKVEGKVNIELSQDLVLKNQEWSFNLSRNRDFGNALITANQIITQNNTKSSGRGG